MVSDVEPGRTVFVGMSGGVDSSVSAALLKKQGYDVVGVFIRTWHPEFLKCNEEEERRDAMRVATHLGIPFLTFDFEDVYKKEVADYMIREYKAGRTPNPDVMCNKEVKFGAFLKKALSMGADYVATGHYAGNKNCLEKSTDIFLLKNYSCSRQSRSQASFQDSFCLVKGVDPSKDQVYFLWTLKQKQLSKILFPIGHLNKKEVRKLAERFKLPVAEKKDSQGICFLGAVDLKNFLKHYIQEKKGEVILVPSEVVGKNKSEVIGFHDGVVFYTLGERHGFTITKKNPNDRPYYVVGKDVKKNILYVSQNKNCLEKSTDIFLLKNVNWIKHTPNEKKNYTAQIRYHGEFLPCRIELAKGGPDRSRRARVIFKNPILVASGQSCVIYDKDICLGGGIII
ncbi:tRNA 2-thiouridine(34) synthase MnmA [Patescibacteria group bacterium]|nr:tRNA 2-thiouridine(34) synthase MnmA [Patescibacteria group bacterium]